MNLQMGVNDVALTSETYELWEVSRRLVEGPEGGLGLVELVKPLSLYKLPKHHLDFLIKSYHKWVTDKTKVVTFPEGTRAYLYSADFRTWYLYTLELDKETPYLRQLTTEEVNEYTNLVEPYTPSWFKAFEANLTPLGYTCDYVPWTHGCLFKLTDGIVYLMDVKHPNDHFLAESLYVIYDFLHQTYYCNLFTERPVSEASLADVLAVLSHPGTKSLKVLDYEFNLRTKDYLSLKYHSNGSFVYGKQVLCYDKQPKPDHTYVPDFNVYVRTMNLDDFFKGVVLT